MMIDQCGKPNIVSFSSICTNHSTNFIDYKIQLFGPHFLCLTCINFFHSMVIQLAQTHNVGPAKEGERVKLNANWGIINST